VSKEKLSIKRQELVEQMGYVNELLANARKARGLSKGDRRILKLVETALVRRAVEMQVSGGRVSEKDLIELAEFLAVSEQALIEILSEHSTMNFKKH
jgi:hypothetical protein